MERVASKKVKARETARNKAKRALRDSQSQLSNIVESVWIRSSLSRKRWMRYYQRRVSALRPSSRS